MDNERDVKEKYDKAWPQCDKKNIDTTYSVRGYYLAIQPNVTGAQENSRNPYHPIQTATYPRAAFQP